MLVKCILCVILYIKTYAFFMIKVFFFLLVFGDGFVTEFRKSWSNEKSSGLSFSGGNKLFSCESNQLRTNNGLTPFTTMLISSGQETNGESQHFYIYTQNPPASTS